MKEYSKNTHIDIGRKRVYFLSDRSFYIDGSLFYTPLSRSDWREFAEDAGDGMVLVRTRSIIIESKKHNILVDCGIGSSGEAMHHKLKDDNVLIDGMRALGFEPSDIDMVMLTHLHYDHCGFAIDDDGNPAFENAHYYVQRQEWDDATNINDLTETSYLPETYNGLMKARVLKLVNGDYVPALGIRLWLTGGHSAGHQTVLVKSKGQGLLFTGDIVPTRYHLRGDIHCAFDLFPLSVLTMKKQIIKLAKKHKWYLAFPHDPDVPYIKL